MSPDMIARARERLSATYGMPMGSEAGRGARDETPAARTSARACTRRTGRSRFCARCAGACTPTRSARRRRDAPRRRRATRGSTAPPSTRGSPTPTSRPPLRADMAATRDPLPEARALAYKLSKSDGGLRYSTSSAVFEHDGRRVVAAGSSRSPCTRSRWPASRRRSSAAMRPGSVAGGPRGAPFALATAKVAELRGIDLDQARGEPAGRGELHAERERRLLAPRRPGRGGSARAGGDRRPPGAGAGRQRSSSSPARRACRASRSGSSRSRPAAELEAHVHGRRGRRFPSSKGQMAVLSLSCDEATRRSRCRGRSCSAPAPARAPRFATPARAGRPSASTRRPAGPTAASAAKDAGRTAARRAGPPPPPSSARRTRMGRTRPGSPRPPPTAAAT